MHYFLPMSMGRGIIAVSMIFIYPLFAFSKAPGGPIGVEGSEIVVKMPVPDYPPAPEIVAQKAQILKELTEPARNKKLKFEMLPVDKTGKTEFIYRGSYSCRRSLVRASYVVDDSDASVTSFTFVLATPTDSETWKGAIVIQPTLAGPSIVEYAVSERLCESGFASVTPTETMLPDVSDLIRAKDSLSVYDKDTRIEMIRAQRMIDFLIDDLGVSEKNIGAIGFSRGAIAVALLAGIETRIRFSYIGAGGIGLAHIIAASKTPMGVEQRQAIMKAWNWSEDQLEDQLDHFIRYDGYLFMDRIRPASTKTMLCVGDTLVPFNTGILMQQRLTNPVTEVRRARSWVGNSFFAYLAQQAKNPQINLLFRALNDRHVGCIFDTVFLEPSSFTNFFNSKFTAP